MNTTNFKLDLVSDNAIQIHFLSKPLPNFRMLATNVKSIEDIKITDVCFAYDTFTVFFNPLVNNLDKLKNTLINELIKISGKDDLKHNDISSSFFEIPVCFCEDCALDKKRIEKLSGIKFNDFVKQYTSVTYNVLFIGFQPGFPFLDGLPAQLQLPRLETPRVKVPVGSVGIGGNQTGIYVFSTPGGWNIIGRTNFRRGNWSYQLFDFEKGATLQAGNRISFKITNCK